MRTEVIKTAQKVLIDELNQLKALVKEQIGSEVSICLTDDNPHENTLLSLILEFEMVHNEDEENGLALSISILTYNPFKVDYTPLENKLNLLCDLSTSIGTPMMSIDMREIEPQNEQALEEWIDTVRSFIKTNQLYIVETLRNEFS